MLLKTRGSGFLTHNTLLLARLIIIPKDGTVYQIHQKEATKSRESWTQSFVVAEDGVAMNWTQKDPVTVQRALKTSSMLRITTLTYPSVC